MITSMLGIPGLEKMSPMFRAELWRLAQRLGLDPALIAAVMKHESGFDPAATNKLAGATGLIQFMPATARAMGTSTDDLRRMSAEDQLKWVERFFKPYAKTMRPDVPGDYLMATFMPAFIGKPPETVLFAKGTIGYTQNAGFDHAGKGAITIADVTGDIDKIVAQARALPSVEVDTTLPLGGAGSLPPVPSHSVPLPSFSGPSVLPVLKLGSSGLAVAVWQRYLVSRGYLVLVSGVYSAGTSAATAMYQEAYNAKNPDRTITVDGDVGPQTWGTMLA